jgi:hypothetical protein
MLLPITSSIYFLTLSCTSGYLARRYIKVVDILDVVSVPAAKKVVN